MENLDKPVVAVDMDEILAPFTPGFCEFYNREYGGNFRSSDFYVYEFWEIMGITKDQAIDRVFEFYKDPLFLNTKRIKGSAYGVGQLSRNHDLILVTSRPENPIKKQTLRWLDRYFAGKFNEKNVYLTNAFSKSKSKIAKSKICLENNAKIIIEDNLECIQDCVNKGMYCILFDYPWNQTEDNDQSLDSRIIRVRNWKQALNAIGSLNL